MWTNGTLPNFYDNVHSALIEGSFDKAMEQVSTFVPSDLKEKRMLGHATGKIYLLKHDYLNAIAVFEKTLEDCGPHIGLNLDLANSYFLQNSFGQWRLLVETLSNEISDLEKKINPTNLLRSKFLLAKFQEELGLVNEARSFYQNTLEATKLPTQQAHLVSQLLRIDAEFSPTPQIEIWYSTLLQFDRAQLGFSAEFLHSQIMAEVVLFGPEVAVQNFFDGLRRFSVPHELEFIASDLCEALLCRGIQIPARLISYLEKSLPSGAYESAIRNLVVYDIAPDENSIFRTMCFAEAVRLFAICASTGSPAQRLLKVRQGKTLLKGLGKNSKLWQDAKFGVSSANPESTVAFKEGEMRILFEKHEFLDFSGRKALWDFALLFKGRRVLSFDKIAAELWNLEVSDSTYQRIRRNVERANQLAYAQILKEPFSIRNQEVHFQA